MEGEREEGGEKGSGRGEYSNKTTTCWVVNFYGAISNDFAIVMALVQWLHLQTEKSFTARNGQEDRFLTPFMQRRRGMAHPGMTNGFLQLSPEAATLPGPSGKTWPPPVLCFLLAQNLSPKEIARSDISS